MEIPIQHVQQLRRISVRATGLKPDQLAWLRGANCVCFPDRHAACGPFTLVVFPAGTWRQKIPRSDAARSHAKSFLIGLPNSEIIEEVTRPEMNTITMLEEQKKHFYDKTGQPGPYGCPEPSLDFCPPLWYSWFVQ